MTQNEWSRLAREYHAAKVAAAREKMLAEKIKAAMAEAGVETIDAGGFILTAKPVTSKRFDSSLFAQEHKDLYEQYKKPNTAVRLTIR